MAYQAAYFSMYGRTESTYEPAMTKAFLHGRTEAIRSVTPEFVSFILSVSIQLLMLTDNRSVAFVKSFCSDASARTKIDALRKACRAHTELTKACIQGKGQDRILYAMYCLAQQKTTTTTNGMDSDSGEDEKINSIPNLFADAGYATLGHSTLSTSNCGNPALRLFGFGAVVPDGFGIGYIIKDDSIAFCASSKHLQTERFLDTLRLYFVEVHGMMKELHREANRRPNSVRSSFLPLS